MSTFAKGGFAAGLVLGLFGWSAWVAGAGVLSVDFDGTATGATQAGFQGFFISQTATPGPMSSTFPVSDPAVTSGSVTVTVSAGADITSTNNLLTRDRGAIADAGSFTYGNFYRDLLIATGTNTILNLQLSGLNPSTQYDVTLYAYDKNNSLTPTFTNVTGGASSPSATYTSLTTVSSNGEDGRTLRVTSSAAGAVVFRITNTGGNAMQGILNGVELASVPEPASAAALAGAAALALLARRRRPGRR